MVRVGFWQAPEVKPEPSITNRFRTSWDCWYALRTEVFGSRPIRATPTSWMPKPGTRSGEAKGSMFLAPAASIISTADSAMSGIIARSFSPHAMWTFRIGMPQASTWPEGSISTRFSK
jgi:hypothetical protein